MGNQRYVRLVEFTGPTSCRIDALIKPNGDLEISGQDIGELPRTLFGDEEYEYWLTVPASQVPQVMDALNSPAKKRGKTLPGSATDSGQEDQNLLNLLANAYPDNSFTIMDFRQVLEKLGIDSRFTSL